MDQMGDAFLIMVKGMKNFIREIILENMGSFETKRNRCNDRFDVYGTTTERRLFDGEEQKRFIHIFYSDGRAYGEKQEIKQRVKRLKAYLNQCVGRECESFGPEIQKYFYLHYENDGRTLKLAEENTKAIEEELSLAGYFAIVSSDRMTAKEAIERYKSRDASEKLFRADQSYLGNRSMRVGSDAALSTKIFIQFLALILRCRIYTDLKDKCEAVGKRPNDMTPCSFERAGKNRDDPPSGWNISTGPCNHKAAKNNSGFFRVD